MMLTKALDRCWLPALLACLCIASAAEAQQAVRRPASAPAVSGRQLRPQKEPSYRVAGRPAPVESQFKSRFGPAQPNEHPLLPALRWAEKGEQTIKDIQDYSAVVIKRERINGTLGDYQYMFVKVRQNPFGVYMYFLKPSKLKGQEVLFLEGQNNGNMWAHGTGVQKKMFGTLSLKPTGMIAMRGQRYPITELGIGNLIQRLLEVGQEDIKYGECEVNFIEGAKVNGRSCNCIQVIHPVPRKNFLFHQAMIFVDDELNLPIRYAAYDWPRQAGARPELIEEYTYTNVKLNNSFTDADFDIRNPNYNF